MNDLRKKFQRVTLLFKEGSQELKALRLVAFFSLSFAVIISCYLFFIVTSQQAVAGCSGGGACSQVLYSKWSTLLGVSVSVFGLLSYLVILVWQLVKERLRAGSLAEAYARVFSATAAALVVLGAVWFTFVQVALLKSFCPWCCATHFFAVIGVASFALIARGENRGQLKADSSKAVFEKNSLEWSSLSNPWVSPASAVVILGAMIAIQHSGEEITGEDVVIRSEADNVVSITKNGDSLRLTLNAGSNLDLREVPMIGSAEAENVMVIISDYSCGHCRKLHVMLDEVQQAHGDEELAIIELPGFRTQSSVKVYQAILPLWKADREIYQVLHEDLYASKIGFTPELVIAAVEKRMGGKQAYQAAVQPHLPWARQIMATSSRVFRENSEKAGRKVLPQLMVQDEVIVGASKSASRYYDLVSKKFGLADLSDSQFAKEAEKQHELVEQRKKADLVKEAMAKEPTPPMAGLLYSGSGSGILNLHGDEFSIKASELPSIGSPVAKNLAAFLFDYTCPHCLYLHGVLNKVQQEWGDGKLGIVMLPGVRNGHSEAIHRLMMALWKANPVIYERVAQDLIAKNLKADPEVIRLRADELLGDGVLAESEKIHAKWIAFQINRSKEIYRKNTESGKKGFPQLMVGQEISNGAFPKELYYESLFKRQFAPNIPVLPQRMANVEFSRNGSRLGFHSDGLSIDASQSLIWGEPSAENLLPLLIDYQSKECLAVANRLIAMQSSSKPGELAVLLLPATPTGEAQRIHRQMLLLWKYDQSSYREMMNAVLSGQLALTAEITEAEVALRIGSDYASFQKSSSQWLHQQLLATHRLFAANRKLSENAPLPHLLFKGKLYTGSLPDNEALGLVMNRRDMSEQQVSLVKNKNSQQ